MELHELIDRDNPKCLYCNSDFNVLMTGVDSAPLSSLKSFDIESLTCRGCNEKFIIHSQTYNSETEYVAFFFTCIDLCISYTYNKNHFGVSLLSRKFDSTHVPLFEIDFSDKEKLYKKLKTYLTFS